MVWFSLNMISSKYFFPLKSSSIFIVLTLFWDFGNSESLTLGTKSSSSFKTAGYESLVPANSSREGRRSVVSGGLFSIVSFDNVPCLGTSGDVGTCYSARECTNLNGNALGTCAGNFGVCCVITATCGATITTNNTYFVNPGNPSTTVGPLHCVLTINKLAGATELYLEFGDFNIRGPTSGNCLNDTFKVSLGGSTTALSSNPTLCGNNTNQMLYYGISAASGPFTLTFDLATGSDPRSWKIRIVQFKPTDACAAPPGCNLFFRDLMGMVETFNFNMGKGELINNFCVNVCFQLQPGFCSILLTENEFMLSGIAPNDCTEGDFLAANNQQFCGDTLANGMLIVNSTTANLAQFQVCSGKDNADMDLGFNLNYTQTICSATG